MELFPFSKVNFNENLLSSVTFIISRSLISKVSPVSQDFLIKTFWKPFEIFENFWKHFRHYDTAWKMSVFGVFLVHIFPHSDWIRGDQSISPYSARMRENINQKNSEYRHFSRNLNSSWSFLQVIIQHLKKTLTKILHSRVMYMNIHRQV